MNGSSRRRTTSDDGVPDLTPHINDPTEHLRNIFKGFCGQNLDLGDRRPPVVPRDTIASRKRTPEVCGFLCMDSHSKEVEPCLPCKSEQVELSTNADSSTTNGHQRSIVLGEPSSQELDDGEDVMDIQDDKPARRIMDMLMATVVALFVTVYALRRLGYSFDLSLDDKSFAQSQLEVMGEPSALWNEATLQCNDAVEDGDEGMYPLLNESLVDES